MMLSIIIPAYNERNFIEEVIRRVMDAPYDKEIIIVDDGSTDGTREILNRISNIEYRISNGEMQGSGVRDQRSEAGKAGFKGSRVQGSRLEVGQRPEARGQRPGVRGQRLEARDQRSEAGKAEFEDSKIQNFHEVKVIFHEKNMGKGRAVKTGINAAMGDIVLIQDADLEYDPKDYPGLLEPILEGKADVVYGSRFLGGAHRVHYFWHYVGNMFITLLSNMATDLNLTDMETGYKAFKREVFQGIEIKSNRFGFEPEITAKVARKGCIVYEVPISYYGRSYAEGKKITWKDGVKAVFTILRYKWFSR